MVQVNLTAIVFFVLLCSGSCLPNNHKCSTSCARSGPILAKVKTRYGTPVCYYANSTATFELLLLRSGDICPNPGPVSYAPDSPGNTSVTQQNAKVAYRPSNCFLHSLNSPNVHTRSHRLEKDVWEKILSLGIAKKRKTHRGRRSPRRQEEIALAKNRCHQNNDQLLFCMLNARSLRNKSTEFQDYVTDKRFDIVCICETWLTPLDDAVIADLTPIGYNFKHKPRACRRGGGVGLLFRDELNVSVKSSSDYQSFEIISSTISSKGMSMDLIVVYRPPGNQHSFANFVDEFTPLLEESTLKRVPLVITGDLNIHFDNATAPNTKRFNDLP